MLANGTKRTSNSDSSGNIPAVNPDQVLYMREREEIMLTKVLSIKGIGLLHGAKTEKPNFFRKATLLYAENGRGKSTFASLLTSCSTADAELIEERATIDAGVEPSAELMFGNSAAIYEDAAWSGYKPNIIVYDGNFVNNNVHSGMEVTSSQRANLLDFALGVNAVRARADEARATDRAKTAGQLVKSLKEELQALTKDEMSLPQFRALSEDAKIDEKISDAEQRLEAIKRVAEIKRKPLPQTFRFPELNIDSIFSLLNRTLESVHAKAAAKVTEHLGHLEDSNSAAWVQRGLELAQNENCPFCGQDVSRVELLEMYRIYFDRAYSDLQKSVADTSVKVFSSVNAAIVDQAVTNRLRNNETIEQWEGHVTLNPLTGENDDLARASLENLRDLLESLFARKTSALTEAHGSNDEVKEAARLWQQAKSVYDDENSIVEGYTKSIEDYKSSLASASLDDVSKELKHLSVVKARFSTDAVTIIDKLKDAEADLKDAEREKKTARDTLNQTMVGTLSQFKEDINSHLDEFNAEFRINEFSHNYRGKSPQAEYGIQLRGEAIELAGGRPTFATALSEGDKKTMGFAFFAASTLADPDLGKKIVVIDDPMSSLDAPRRDHTIEVLDQISARAEQVIIIAHDAHFLRAMQGKFEKRFEKDEIGTLHLKMVKNGYSDFDTLDLDYLCQSQYLADYKLVTGVVAGEINDPEGVARGAVALRPLLEGYLHRKYPGIIPTGITLGRAIETIESKGGTNSPCAAMFDRVEELHKMNKYASKFHHNTQPDMVAAQRESQSAIVNNGARILEFIHSA